MHPGILKPQALDSTPGHLRAMSHSRSALDLSEGDGVPRELHEFVEEDHELPTANFFKSQGAYGAAGKRRANSLSTSSRKGFGLLKFGWESSSFWVKNF